MKNDFFQSKRILALFAIILFSNNLSSAQSLTPVLLKDTNEEVREYDPSSFVTLNNEVFFWGFKAETGRELYKLSGSTISLVKDTLEGPSSYYGGGSDYNSSKNIYKLGSSIYFLAGNPSTGVKLYKSGGDSSSTVELGTVATTDGSFYSGNFGGFGSVVVFGMLINGANELWAYNPAVQSTPFKLSDVNAGEFTTLNSRVYFSGCTDSACSFMATDGTVSGTVVVKTGIEANGSYTANGSNLFFRAYQVGTGSELWVSDGTSGGTHIVSDLASGVASSYPTKITSVGSGVIFIAGDGVHSVSNPQDEDNKAGELFYSDGSSISFVKDFNASSMDGGIDFDSEVVEQSGYVYFAGRSSGGSGSSLWKTDGTLVNTVELKESISPHDMFSTGSQILFFKTSSSSVSLYKSDGTPSGTVIVETFTYPGIETPTGYFISKTPINDQILFAVSGSSPKSKSPTTTLYASNLSTNSLIRTLESSGTRSSASSFVSTTLGDLLLFSSHTLGSKEDGANYTYTLFSSKGSSDSTTLLKASSVVDGVGTIIGTPIIVSSSKAVFNQGGALWVTDGSLSGTKNINSDLTLYGDSDKRAIIGDYLYFVGSSASTGTELWRTNGTESGTSLIKDITSGSAGSSLAQFKALNGKLIFTAVTSGSGEELWISDGSESGTSLLKEIRSGASSSSPKFLTELNGVIYFAANDGSNKSSLWKTDGTESGTTLVKTISSSSEYDILGIKRFGSKLIIFATDGSSVGYEPWISDGTESGTQLLSDLNASADSVESFGTNNFMSINSKFYFVANNGSSGNELFVTDGTTSGTRLVSDLVTGASGSDPDWFVALDSTKFVFIAGSSSQKRIWSIDTTTDTVTKLSDSLSVETSLPLLFNGKIYFSAKSSSYGTELYVTDGTSAGTSLVSDILSGTEGSYASPFAVTAHQLYFTANDSSHAVEPWVINLDGCLDDSSKTVPGTCGCGVSEADTDADGNLDCEDLCPSDATKILPGTCGCGKAELDSNKDKIVDCGAPGTVSPGQKLENAPTAASSKKSITVTAQKFSGIKIKGKKKSGKVSYLFELSSKIKGKKVLIQRTSSSNKLKITGLAKGTYKVKYKIIIRDENGRLQKPTGWSPSVSVRVS